MSAVLPGSRAAAPDRPAPAAAARAAAVCMDRSIDHLAVFFDDPAAATEALRDLARQPALARAQLDLLRPEDGSWLHFLRRLQEAPAPGAVPPWQRDGWLLALVGAISGAVTASVALLLGHLDADDLAQALLLNMLAGVAGAAIGVVLSRLSVYLPPYGHFDGVLRQRLAAGHWALRVQNIPWAGQADLLAWLEARELPWYATSTRPARV